MPVRIPDKIAPGSDPRNADKRTRGTSQSKPRLSISLLSYSPAPIAHFPVGTRLPLGYIYILCVEKYLIGKYKE